MESADSVRKIVLQLNLYVDFMNYGMLEHLIKAFGNKKHKHDISAHAQSMERFLRETTVKDLIDHWPGNRRLPPDAEELVVMIDRDPKTCSILELFEIKNEICRRMKVSECICVICRVMVSNSFVILLMVPTVIVDNISYVQPFCDVYHLQYLLLSVRHRYIYLSEAMVEKKVALCVNTYYRCIIITHAKQVCKFEVWNA